MEGDLKRDGLRVMDDDNGGLELSLELSIGKSFKKATRPGVPTVHQIWEHGTESDGVESNRAGSGSSISAFSSRPPLSTPAHLLARVMADGHDPQRRRELHGLQRQEARKKRHAKQQQKGSACGGRGGKAAPVSYGPSEPKRECLLDDHLALEAKKPRQRGARDREMEEESSRRSNRRSGDNYEVASDFVPSDAEINAIPNCNIHSDAIIAPNVAPFGAPLFPLMAMQYAYPHVQYVPMANGYGFPYMMPYWASPMSSVAGIPNLPANIFQPVPYRAFQDADRINHGIVTSSLGYKSTENGAEIKRTSSWNDAGGCGSSSAVSDHQSNSVEGGSGSGRGGGSSEVRNHSSQELKTSNVAQLGQSDGSTLSRQIEAPAADPPVASPFLISTPSGTQEDPQLSLCSRAKQEGGAPVADEPAGPHPAPPRMPCVAATGDGPTGKTITGFLRRNTNAEVSIVCICPGRSFSPAEFVKHAGGADADNPLKRITVVECGSP